jgi:hypothetical protein
MDRESIAAGAAEQVRTILEAAESSAADLREQAAREASEHVGEVREAADATLARLDELERELAGLIETVRERVTAVLGELERDARLAPAGGDTPEFPAPGPAPDAAEVVAAAGDEPVPDADEAGARLIALNMALSGTPREETARYLAERFSLADPDRLLDDVYAQAGR